MLLSVAGEVIGDPSDAFVLLKDLFCKGFGAEFPKASILEFILNPTDAQWKALDADLKQVRGFWIYKPLVISPLRYL